MAKPPNYYGALGLTRGASDSDIKRAYRDLARRLHPDVNPSPAAHERFKRVTLAHAVLTDPWKRVIVDLGGDPLRLATPPVNAGWPQRSVLVVGGIVFGLMRQWHKMLRMPAPPTQ